MSLDKYASRVEAKIARELVRQALAAGWAVSVWEGEGWAIRLSRDEAEICANMASTDHDVLRFHSTEPEGNVTLIYGNDEDLISDHTDKPSINALVNAVGLACGLEAYTP